MKKKITKGDFGYYIAQGKREWIKTLLLFCISLALLLTGMFITKHRQPDISWTDSKNNLLTVAAVLGVLPSARFLINAIMFSRAKKYSCPEILYKKSREMIPEDSPFACELFLTSEKKSFPLCVTVANENEIIACFAGSTSDAAAGEKHIRDMLLKDGKKNISIKLFTEEKAFLDRLKTFSQSEKGWDLIRFLYQISL